MPDKRPTADEWEISLSGGDTPQADRQRHRTRQPRPTPPRNDRTPPRPPRNPNPQPNTDHAEQNARNALVKLAIAAAVLLGILWACANTEVITDGASGVPSLLKDFIAGDGNRQNTAGSPLATNTLAPSTVGSIPKTQTIPPTRTIPTELSKMENADWLRSRHGGTYKTIKELPWVKDGLTPNEAKAAQDLLHMAANDHETLKRVLDLQWVKDDINGSEAKATRNLMYLSYRDQSTSRNLTEMPFLGSITESDALLISGLHGRAHRGTLSEFMAHPTIADGITDDETVLATAVTTIDDQAYMNSLLYPGNATVETIQTASPRTQNLTVSTVRAGTRKTTDSSLIIAEAVEYVEDSMDMPLPTNHVIVLLDDSGVVKGFAGVNYGEAIAYLRKGEDGSDWDRAVFSLGMVHEVAHYFWRGSEDWIDEGMANTIEHRFGVERGLPRQMFTTERKGCSVKTLKELSSLNPSNHSAQFQCNYYLGEKLFLELQNAMTPAAFQQAVNSLYQKSLVLREQDRTAGIQQVREAFQARNDIVQKHWDGTPIPITKADTTGTPTAVPPPTGIKDASSPTAEAPRPIKTPITPTLFFTQDNPDMGFSISIPGDWEAKLERQTATYRPLDSTAHILIIHTSQISREEYLRQAEGQIVTGHLLQSEGDWPELSGSSSWGLNASGASYYETQYVGQHESSQCTENGIIRIHESKSAEGKPITTIVEMVSCQEEADRMLNTRSTILESFTVTRPLTTPPAVTVIPVATSVPVTTIPIATPVPKMTPRPTPTALPTPTAVPRPTATPQPTPTPTPGPEYFMAEGIKLHEEGKHQEALNQFQQARIISGTDTSELKLWQGRSHRALGDLETALRHLDIAVYLDENAINLAERAGIHADMGNEGEALEDGYAARNSPEQTDGWRHSKAQADLVIARGWALIGSWEDSLYHAEEALRVATEHGYPEGRIKVIRTVLEEAKRQLGG